ncbi:MAG: hypothetical protein PHO70_03735 [Candidatus Omnitrophica bacterium]|nr:hypothetical protein [Candidatus Omnitrophota bacterium]
MKRKLGFSIIFLCLALVFSLRALAQEEMAVNSLQSEKKRKQEAVGKLRKELQQKIKAYQQEEQQLYHQVKLAMDKVSELKKEFRLMRQKHRQYILIEREKIKFANQGTRAELPDPNKTWKQLNKQQQ